MKNGSGRVNTHTSEYFILLSLFSELVYSNHEISFPEMLLSFIRENNVSCAQSFTVDSKVC